MNTAFPLSFPCQSQFNVCKAFSFFWSCCCCFMIYTYILRSMTDVDFSLIHLQCVVNNNNDTTKKKRCGRSQKASEGFRSILFCFSLYMLFLFLIHIYTYIHTDTHTHSQICMIIFYSGVSMTSSRFHFRFRLLLSFSLTHNSFSVAAIFL